MTSEQDIRVIKRKEEYDEFCMHPDEVTLPKAYVNNKELHKDVILECKDRSYILIKKKSNEDKSGSGVGKVYMPILIEANKKVNPSEIWLNETARLTCALQTIKSKENVKKIKNNFRLKQTKELPKEFIFSEKNVEEIIVVSPLITEAFTEKPKGILDKYHNNIVKTLQNHFCGIGSRILLKGKTDIVFMIILPKNISPLSNYEWKIKEFDEKGKTRTTKIRMPIHFSNINKIQFDRGYEPKNENVGGPIILTAPHSRYDGKTNVIVKNILNKHKLPVLTQDMHRSNIDNNRKPLLIKEGHQLFSLYKLKKIQIAKQESIKYIIQVHGWNPLDNNNKKRLSEKKITANENQMIIGFRGKAMKYWKDQDSGVIKEKDIESKESHLPEIYLRIKDKILKNENLDDIEVLFNFPFSGENSYFLSDTHSDIEAEEFIVELPKKFRIDEPKKGAQVLDIIIKEVKKR